MESNNTRVGNNTRASLEVPILLTSIFIISICAILYELLISTISTYLLGSSILHFSLTIGFFLSSMGVGAYISKYFNNYLLEKFINAEIALGIIGGLSAFILHLTYTMEINYYLVLFSLISVLGMLVGLEIPLLTRILKDYSDLKDTIAKVLAFDYLGALVASVFFPLLLLPYLGVMRTSFVVGLINLSIAIVNLLIFKYRLPGSRRKIFISGALSVLLILGFVYSFKMISFFETFQYQDQIIFSKQTTYQRIIVTKWKKDLRLFINGNLQFSTIDEYRYHEPLVHVPLLAATQKERILVLGGGDGLVCREVLKYDEVQEIDLVDIDEEITGLAQRNALFKELNKGSLNNPKVHIHNIDAFNYVKENSKLYDVIIIDLPDPNDTSLGKLYSREFYKLIKRSLSRQGIVVTQSTSPYFAAKPFWCIHNTLSDVFPYTVPYKSYVPTFGLWGYNVAGNIDFCDTRVELQDTYRAACLVKILTEKISNHNSDLQFLNKNNLSSLFYFDKDNPPLLNIKVNTLDNQELVNLYEKSWENWE